MALTEKEQRKLEEEEAYRAKLHEEETYRHSLHTKPKRKGLHPVIKVIGIIFISIILISAISTYFASKPTTETTSNLSTTTGTFLDYNYEITTDTSSEYPQKYVASFTPFLPNKDGVLLGMIAALVNTTYGKHTVTDLTPRFEERNGVTLMTYQATDGKYYFMPIKEDTGEINSLLFWKE